MISLPRCLTIVAVPALLTVGCSSDPVNPPDDSQNNEPPTPAVAQVTLTPRDPILAAFGATRQLTAGAKDAAGNMISNPTLTWTSRSPAVATVDGSGVVTGVSAGTAQIVASANGVADSTTITILQAHEGLGIGAGEHHSCGLTTAGKAYCWGLASEGELGTGSANPAPSPSAVVGGLVFSSITVGYFQTCGLTGAGKAYCWGTNTGSGGGSSTPVGVQGAHVFTMLSSGRDHTCGVTDTGAGFCWGADFAGALGTGSNNVTGIPTAVSGGLTLAAVAAGMFHTCGLTTG